jgi:uncharacterized membrane protein
VELSIFLLVIAAASIHALWNLITKKVSGNLGTIAIGLWAASLGSLPFALHYILKDGLPALSLYYIGATGVIHAFYFYYIGKCYEIGDISTVYPVARGFGVAGTGIVAATVLGENISQSGAAGIMFVCLGILIIGIHKSDEYTKGNSLRYALVVGMTIIAYSYIDKVGVALVNPVSYISGMFTIAAVTLTVVAVTWHRDLLIRSLRTQIVYGVAIGIGSISTYLIILFAFRQGPLSYIAAVREFSVAIGSVMGFLFLKERLTAKKVFGITAITLGLILIKIA